MFLTAGAAGLIDCLLERGNPTDSTKAVNLAARAIKVLGTRPEQIVFDGGLSSRANLTGTKALGVRDVAFSKAPGLASYQPTAWSCSSPVASSHIGRLTPAR